MHLAWGNPKSKVISIDACKNTLTLAQKHLDQNEIQNATLILGRFEDYLNQDLNLIFDLVYIDGHHNGKALKNYLKQLEKFTNENTIFLLDDIRWSDDMFQSWNEIIAKEEFHLTIDLFRMGIIIRRPQQVKEHFVIKLKNVLSGF
jgi:predicted O-methyltransferase YrrM